MFKNNPELKKNLKLELSLGKLLLPAILLALAAWLGWGSADKNQWRHLPLIYEQSQSLTYWIFGFGFIFSIIWGSYLTSNSFFGEVRQKTWDFIRMSPLTPGKILIGKIFGAPSAVWIITLAGILPIILFASSGLILNGGYHRPYESTLFSLTLALIFWMILSYSFVFLCGLYTLSKDNRHNTIGTVILVLISGLFIGGFISSSYQSEYKIKTACNLNTPCSVTTDLTYNGINYTKSYIDTVDWYVASFFPLDSIALLLGFFAFWTVVGTYRNLQKTLQYKIYPYVWPMFVITTTLLLNGFNWGERQLDVFLPTWTCIFALLIFAICIKESQNTIQYRQLIESIKTKDYKSALRLTPLWLISLICFITIFPVLFGLSEFGLFQSNGASNSTNFILFFVSILIFIIRDIMAIHIISWQKNVRMPAIRCTLYFLVIYILAPMAGTILFGGDKSGSLYFQPLIPYQNLLPPSDTGYIILHLTIIALFSRSFIKGLKRILGQN